MSQSYYEDEVLGKAYDARLMKRLLTYALPYKLHVGAAILLLFVVSLLQLAGPYLVKVAIDVHIGSGNLRGLGIVSILYLLTLVMSLGLRYLQEYVVIFIGQKVIYDLRVGMFAHLENLSLSYFDRNPMGRLLTRFTSDVQVVEETFSSGLVSVFGDLFMLIGIVIAMVAMDFRLALVTFSILPLLAFATIVFRRYIKRLYRLMRIALSKVNAYLAENVTGMKVVQSFNREVMNLSRFKKLNQDYTDTMLKAMFYFSIFMPTVEIINSLAVALIIWYGGGRIIGGALTLGVLVAFIQYSERFFRPLMDLTERYNIMQAAMASSERIFELLDTKPLIDPPPDPVVPLEANGSLQFKNVWFAYNDDDYVLRDVSFEAKNGQSIALVGATGSGKTTIVNLLCRFYDVQKGQVLVDEVNVRDMEEKELRSRIAIVLQDVFLFAGDIESNIRLGNPKITSEDVIRSAEYVNADKFIKRLPDGYREEVRERGSNFSTGEKQLLAFARALAFDPKILILDEATSNVDTETEILIQEALDRLMKDRTSIIVAHRLSTIQSVDKIIVLHKGEIKEMGSHQELLAKRGMYYRLYELQYKGQEASVADEVAKF